MGTGLGWTLPNLYHTHVPPYLQGRLLGFYDTVTQKTFPMFGMFELVTL